MVTPCKFSLDRRSLHISYSEKQKISEALKTAYNKASEASTLEINNKNNASAIKKWGEVFGDSFLKYEGV